MSAIEVDTGTLTTLVSELLDSYEEIDIPKRQYVTYVLLPSLLFFAGSVAGAVVLPLDPLIRVPIPALGLLVFGSALAYPKIYLSSRRAAIDNQLHLMMTHMTVLSTTNIDRMEVFRTIANVEEYGVLADEIGRVVHLVDTWNQSLDDACRRRAKEVPSDALSDFLDRLGYTLGVGQSLSDFLVSEQDVVIDQYVTTYEGALANLEVMKDLYMSMILSMTFALVFAVVLPILTGTSPTMTVAAVIVMFVLVQLGFYVTIRAMAPHDPVWYRSERTPPGRRRLQAGLAVSALFVFALLGFEAAGIFGVGPGIPGLFFFLSDVPLPLYLAVPVTPLLIAGLLVRREERAITARDEEFPSFIRALGASSSAKQATTSEVLTTLRRKDFGTLTDSINRLYRRLNIRLDTKEAWAAFAADTRSYLIQKFGDMYVEGRQMGGDPQLLGELISENMSTVVQLREQRRQATVTLVGLLYGITAASSFAFFIGLQVVAILAELASDFNVSDAGGFSFGQIIYAGVYNIPLIEYLLLLVILFNALLSAVMIRTIDGGNKVNAYLHFVLLTWVGCLTAIGTKFLVANLLSVG